MYIHYFLSRYYCIVFIIRYFILKTIIKKLDTVAIIFMKISILTIETLFWNNCKFKNKSTI